MYKYKSTNNNVVWNPSRGNGVIAASHAREIDALTCALSNLNTYYIHRICSAEAAINGRVPRTVKILILQNGYIPNIQRPNTIDDNEHRV